MTSQKEPIRKSVGTEWVWLANYRTIKTNFHLEVPAGRSVEIGTGLAPQGMPWGARRLLNSPETLTVHGFGCVSARVADHEGLCQISIQRI